MPAGEAVDNDDQRRIERAIRIAEQLSGLTFSVFVGELDDDPRGSATELHGSLPHPEDSVLVAVDLDRHALEIVTGSLARRVLDDFDCRLAAASMETSFAAEDLTGGLVNGVQQLGQSARRPETLHTARPN